MNSHEFVSDYLHLKNKELINDLIGASKILNLKKGNVLIQAGDMQEDVIFVITGILRGFLIDIDGKDITDCFTYKCGDHVMTCYGFNDVSSVNIEAMADSQIFMIPINIMHSLMTEHVELIRLYNRILMEALEYYWNIKNIMHMYTAKERYLWFLREYPDLTGKIPNKHIASFLNMNPVSLSRIRRQLQNERLVQDAAKIQCTRMKGM